MGQRPPDDPTLDAAREVKERAAPRLRSYPNVTGVGVGYREIRGQVTPTVCLRVYVSRKVPRSELRPEDVLPESVEGIPVDVIEAIFRVHPDEGSVQDHRAFHDPLVGGISIGNLELGGSGTLGMFVVDNQSGEDAILSNWHVLCGQPDCAAGEPIIQPGSGGGDAGGPDDIVALVRRFALTDQVDAAIAGLTGDRLHSKEVLGLGPVFGVGGVVLGATLRKSGRTTGVTSATLVDGSADIDVDYGPQLGTRLVLDQIVVRGDNPSEPGDSGSIWVDDASRAVGLNFAGSPGVGVANPMAAVLLALEVNVDEEAALVWPRRGCP